MKIIAMPAFCAEGLCTAVGGKEATMAVRMQYRMARATQLKMRGLRRPTRSMMNRMKLGAWLITEWRYKRKTAHKAFAMGPAAEKRP
jgi:hypothetical protein